MTEPTTAPTRGELTEDQFAHACQVALEYGVPAGRLVLLDYIEKAALRSSPPVAPEWQTIETMPDEFKDGRTFLSCHARQGNLMAVTWFSKVHAYFVATGGQHLYSFTHWMPLPPAPTKGALR